MLFINLFAINQGISSIDKMLINIELNGLPNWLLSIIVLYCLPTDFYPSNG